MYCIVQYKDRIRIHLGRFLVMISCLRLTFFDVFYLFQVDHSIIQREMNGTLVLSEPHTLWLGGINSSATRLKRDVHDVESLRNFTGDISSKSALEVGGGGVIQGSRVLQP